MLLQRWLQAFQYCAFNVVKRAHCTLVLMTANGYVRSGRSVFIVPAKVKMLGEFEWYPTVVAPGAYLQHAASVPEHASLAH